MTDYFKYRKAIFCRDTNENVLGYVRYLKTAHWMNIRLKLIKEKTVCSHCGEKHSNMQAHHLHYNTIGCENIHEDLCVLCKPCHEIMHKAMVKMPPLICASPKNNLPKNKKSSPKHNKICRFARWKGKRGKGNGGHLHCKIFDEQCVSYNCASYSAKRKHSVKVYLGNTSK